MGLFSYSARVESKCPENTCGTPPSSFTTKHGGSQPCYLPGRALAITCETGFQRSRGADQGDFIAVCRADGTWEWTDSCRIGGSIWRADSKMDFVALETEGQLNYTQHGDVRLTFVWCCLGEFFDGILKLLLAID